MLPNQFELSGGEGGSRGQVLYLAKHRIREKAKDKYEDKVEVEEKGPQAQGNALQGHFL